MKILLLGEYSNLHATLAEGLRKLGHQVLVVSDGTYIYDYPRDIALNRKGTGRLATVSYALKLLRTLPRLTGFDIVQLINPDFLTLKAERQFSIYRFLRRHNKHLVLGAFGNDWQWVKRNLEDRFMRYGDFYTEHEDRTQVPHVKKVIDEWYHSEKGRLSRYVADDCDAIVACLYEYVESYRPSYPEKTRFIPLPIVPKEHVKVAGKTLGEPVKFFLGIKRKIMELKGMDLFYDVLLELKKNYPDQCEITIAEDLPFAEYVKKMEGQDVILDQAYSYTPAMNALEAMSRGIVCVGGGEPENYEILGEKELRPIINILPDRKDIYQALEQLVLHPERLQPLKEQSIAYVEKHHDYLKVAQQYESLYQDILNPQHG